MLTIMGIALVTLGGSYMLFFFASSGLGWGTTNNGQFVNPPLTTSDLGWSETEADRVWWVWVVADNQCAADCDQMVKDMRALHILLNREASRVRRAVTSISHAEVLLSEPFPKLERVSVKRPDLVQRGVYVVDPNGNLVFFYAMSVDPKLIKEDLKKLLRVSQIG